MSKPQWIRVEFPGHGTFYVEDDVLRGERTGPIAPEDHIVDGELDWSRCFSSDSYAHCCEGGTIKRYQCDIGHIRDLRPIDRIAVIGGIVS